MDWNEDIIKNITDQKITDDEFAGKLIAELGDVVLNDAESLKKRFDAAATEVITPKHNELAEATQAAITELRGAVDELETGEGGVTELKLDLAAETQARIKKDSELEVMIKTNKAEYDNFAAQTNTELETKAGSAALAAERQARVDAIAAVDARSANLYAPKGHTHEEYAAKEHTHEEYAATGHTHEEYAAKEHTHEEYAAKEHTHMKLLWQGSAVKGDSITAPGIRDYKLFRIITQVSNIGVFTIDAALDDVTNSYYGYIAGEASLLYTASASVGVVRRYSGVKLQLSKTTTDDNVTIAETGAYTMQGTTVSDVRAGTATSGTITAIYGIA